MVELKPEEAFSSPSVKNVFQNISKTLYSRPLINRDLFYGGSSEGLKVKYNIAHNIVNSSLIII